MHQLSRQILILIFVSVAAMSWFCRSITEAPAGYCLLSGLKAVALIRSCMTCRIALGKGRYSVPVHGWLLLAFLFCVVVGDLVYSLGLGQVRYPRNIIGDFAFGAGFVCMAILMARYLRASLSRIEWGLAVAIFAACILCQWIFILKPAEIQHNLPFVSILSVSLYSFAAAALTGLAAVGSVKSLGFFDTWITHLFLFYASFDFACRYEAVISPEVSVNGASLGWSFSLVAIATLVFAQSGRAAEAFDGSAQMRPLASVRGWAGLCAAGSLAVVTLLQLQLRLLRVENAFQITLLLSLAFCVYLALNLVSTSLSNSLMDITSASENPAVSHRKVSVAWDPGALLELQFVKRLQERLRLSDDNTRIPLQVAHDIRSPIAALKAILPDMPKLETESAMLYARAVERLDAISADLLLHKRPIACESLPEQEWQAADVIESLVCEKRVVYPSKRIRYDCLAAHAHEHVSVNISKVDFSRVLSNILNNAIEASSEDGVISISLQEDADSIAVHVEDCGCGMVEEILHKVRQGLTSYGKADGHGLGISGALRVMQRIGGSLEIDSEPSVGTRVVMKIPKRRKIT